MREVLILDYCDPCYREGNKVEGNIHVVTIGHRKSDKPRKLTLCEIHEKELLQPLAVELAEAPLFKDDEQMPSTTTVTTKPGPKPGERNEGPNDPVKCDVCEKLFGIENIAKNPSSAHSHRLQRHGLAAVDYKAWARGAADVVSADPETFKVEVRLHDLPPLSDTTWTVPDDFRCEHCNEYEVDPREFGTDAEAQRKAFRKLGSHKSRCANSED